MTTIANGALTNTAVLVKGGGGRLVTLSVFNPNTSDAYVQVFNARATSSVTVGTTAPWMILWVPGSTARERTFLSEDGSRGRPFDTGIVLAATTTATGSSAPSTALVVEDAEFV